MIELQKDIESLADTLVFVHERFQFIKNPI